MAAEALRWMGRAEPEVLEALVGRLRDAHRRVRRAAALALGEMGEAAATPGVVGALTERLGDGDSAVRQAAAEALRRMGEAAARPEVLRALVLRLESDDDPEVRAAAARALGRMGPRAATPEVLRALAGRLRDEDRAVRRAAAGALGRMGPAAATPEVLRAMVESLMEDPDLPGDVAGALREMGPSAATPEVVEALAERLRRELGPEHRYLEADVLRECLGMAAALAAAGEAARPEVVRTFRGALKRWGDPDIVRSAARTLGEMGPSAAVPGILQALAECVREEYLRDDARREAFLALWRMGEAAAVPEVLEALRECLRRRGDWEFRLLAVRTLWMIRGEASPEALACLTECLRISNEDARLEALEVVRDMGPPAARPDVLRLAAKRLWDEDPFVRAVAAEALRAMGAADPEILGALEELLQVEGDPRVREAAGRALEALRSRSGPGGSA